MVNFGIFNPKGDHDERSLADLHGSVRVHGRGNWLKRFLAFAGPAYLVSVGYMDPGNWATDLAGGSKYGYALLWVVLVSSLMAMLLQTLCARMGIAIGKDLAQACRDHYKKPAVIALWLLCEIAIVACDIAEVIGSAVGLNLLFGMPLVLGVLLTGCDVLLLLALSRFGFRKIEAVVVTLVATIMGCFAWNTFASHPDWGGVARGLVTPSLPDKQALVIAVGILGATVMPHNLYLHSSIVQTRKHEDETPTGKKHTISLATWDTLIALGGAFFVNAAILVLAASVFHRGGMVAEELETAYKLLTPTLGSAAATLFAVALLASGQSSTITATLAGQIVMEGFVKMRVKPWIRRIVTRGLAIVPAVIMVGGAGGDRTNDLLVLTQVVLSMQLPFAIFPLVAFTSDRKLMGEFVNPLWLKVVAYVIGIAVTLLNMALLVNAIGFVGLAITLIVIGAFSAWVHFGYRTPAANPG